MLVRIVAPYFDAGVVLDAQERCVRAAPIVDWAVGLHRRTLREEFHRRGWHASVIDEEVSCRHPLLVVARKEGLSSSTRARWPRGNQWTR
jgi:hypothetical protein